MIDPRFQKQFGDPPAWFFEIYDAKIQNLSVAEIRRQPLTLRWRYRATHELMKEANTQLAKNSKADAVYDYAKHY